jgi:hypothetical protein
MECGYGYGVWLWSRDNAISPPPHTPLMYGVALLIFPSQVLPKAPSNTVWAAGDTVEVAWGVRANHGGGYQYRICPTSALLQGALTLSP